MKKVTILMIGLVFIVMLVLTAVNVDANPNQRVGFDVVIESFGCVLIDYEITNKFWNNEPSEKFNALEIDITCETQSHTLYWIMTKDRYNELKEKV